MTVEAGIATVLRSLPDPFIATANLRAEEGWPDTVKTDVAIVDGPVTYEDNDMHGCAVAQTYEITLLFSLSAGMERARSRLMPYLAPNGSKSIRAALYAAPTLGGNVQGFNWRGLQSAPGRIQLSGKGLQSEVSVDEYYGAVLSLEVVV